MTERVKSPRHAKEAAKAADRPEAGIAAPAGWPAHPTDVPGIGRSGPIGADWCAGGSGAAADALPHNVREWQHSAATALAAYRADGENQQPTAWPPGEALERAKKAEKPKKKVTLSQKELNVPISKLDDFSKNEVERFLSMAKLDSSFGSELFNRQFHQLGYLALGHNNEYTPTGFGLLLFGERPQLSFPNALIRATLKTQGRNEEVQTFQGSLPSQVDQIQNWYETRIGSQIDRTKAERQVTYDYPLAVFREAIINAVVHRDYDIEGAPIYFEINDDAIVVKSPGLPVSPISVDQIKQFNAPSLSRNPKIMYAFDQLKLVEQRGLGFMTMKGLLDQDLPLPIITVEQPYLIFTFPRYYSSLKELGVNDRLKELNDEQLKGYQWLTLVKEASAREYSSHFDIGYKTAQRHLAKMKDLDLIGDNGQAVNSPHFKYVIKEE